MATDAGKRGRGPKPLVHQGGAPLHRALRGRRRGPRASCVVAGVDEVGRGALCGPVVAGAVVLGDGFDTTGLDDSKRLTAAPARALLGPQSAREARGVGARRRRARRDRPREHPAGDPPRDAAGRRRAVCSRPDLLLVDALTVPGVSLPQQPIVKGDALSVSIAAASIVAKVARDAMMREWDSAVPGLRPGAQHGLRQRGPREALRRLGPSRDPPAVFPGDPAVAILVAGRSGQPEGER